MVKFTLSAVPDPLTVISAYVPSEIPPPLASTAQSHVSVASTHFNTCESLHPWSKPIPSVRAINPDPEEVPVPPSTAAVSVRASASINPVESVSTTSEDPAFNSPETSVVVALIAITPSAALSMVSSFCSSRSVSQAVVFSISIALVVFAALPTEARSRKIRRATSPDVVPPAAREMFNAFTVRSV